MSTYEDIRNILNRIDGVNAPVQEDDNSDYIKQAYMLAVKHHTDGSGDGNINEDIGDLIEDYNEKATKKISPEQIMRISKNYNAGGDYVEVLSAEGIDGKLWLEVAKKKYSQLESAVQEGHYPHIKSFDKLYGINDMQQYKAMADDAQSMDMGEFMDTYSSVIDMAGDFWEDHQKTSEDSGELSRLKELSGIEEEDAGLTDQQKQGLKTVYEKYKNRKGYNGDVLPIGYLDYNVDTGIWFDGADEKEVEAAMKKLGHADMDAWEEAAEGEEYEQFLELAPITGQMIGDLSDVLGDNFTSNDALMKAALAYMNSIDESYEPFPEADEFDINEDEDFEEVLGPLGFPEDELWEAEYRGRKVPLNKPMRGDVKKFKVYVKDPKSGNIKKVNFGHGGTSAKKLGQKTMKIRKSNPKARKSFRARHNCANPGPKTKARYWSCRKW